MKPWLSCVLSAGSCASSAVCCLQGNHKATKPWLSCVLSAGSCANSAVCCLQGNHNEAAISQRCESLQEKLNALQQAANNRKARLDDNSAFLQFIWKTDVVESWIGEHPTQHTQQASSITRCYYGYLRIFTVVVVITNV